MLLIILLVLLLVLVQAMLPGVYLGRQVGNDMQMGPRDNLPEPTVQVARSRRALANLHETLPIFLTLAILSIIFGEQGWLSIGGALLYLVGRVVHLPCYMLGLSPWRSMAFGVASLGFIIMAAALLPHLWS